MAKKKKNKPYSKPLNYKQKALAELKAKYPNYVLKSGLLGALFFGGLVLTIWEIAIYRATFISVYIPLSIWVFTGLLITPFFKKTFNIYCFNLHSPERTSLFLHLVNNIVSFGGILVFLFMWINQTFKSKSGSTITLPIISYGHLAKSRRSCGNPYVHVVYKGEEKELIFSCGTEIEKYNNVSIEVASGLYGFDVIVSQTLIQGQW